MIRLATCGLVLLLAQPVFSQQNFNDATSLSIDLSGLSVGRAHYFSSELEFRRRRQFFLVGYSLDYYVHSADILNGYKVGYGIYPYKNLKKLKVYHQIYYYSESNSSYEGWDGRYGVLGTGLEYWFTKRFSAGFSLHTGWGYATPRPGARGLTFYGQALITLKGVLLER